MSFVSLSLCVFFSYESLFGLTGKPIRLNRNRINQNRLNRTLFGLVMFNFKMLKNRKNRTVKTEKRKNRPKNTPNSSQSASVDSYINQETSNYNINGSLEQLHLFFSWTDRIYRVEHAPGPNIMSGQLFGPISPKIGWSVTLDI